MPVPVRIVLVEPSHPGNIGAVARAMKTMGLHDLALVAPRNFPHADATARAAGADDLLAAARICADLDEALADCRLVIGSSARERAIRWPCHTPREAAAELIAACADGPAALLFGPERTGLSNDHLDRCHALASIPTDPAYASLNLAAAVQVFTYELRVALLESAPPPESDPEARRRATAAELEGLYDHLERTLHAVAFIDPERPGRIMRRLRRLFARALPEEDEVQILRGILTEVGKRLERPGD
jgi:tRNA/rRNA methyltransferase/tRNA (cytidine32/uridine32-2'-O)-methyltransferase